MACARSLQKAFAASKQKEFREVWLQDVLGESLLQFSKPAVGMVKNLLKVCNCSLKRKKPTTPAAPKIAFGRVYIGEISKQCKWRRLRKAGVTMEKLGGSGHTGNHPGRCPKHGLLPRLAPVAITEERLTSLCPVAWAINSRCEGLILPTWRGLHYHCYTNLDLFVWLERKTSSRVVFCLLKGKAESSSFLNKTRWVFNDFSTLNHSAELKGHKSIMKLKCEESHT